MTSVPGAPASLTPLYTTSGIAASFAVIYQALQVEPSNIAALFVSSAPLVSAVLWLQRDARHTRVRAVTD
jgi:hypothetical protein